MKTIEDFERQIKAKNITHWPIHNCGFCGYRCGYVFEGSRVGYDSGCDCVTYSSITERSLDDVVSHYNLQTSEEVIKKMNEFWGFNSD